LPKKYDGESGEATLAQPRMVCARTPLPTTIYRFSGTASQFGKTM
jgi:hypothetical protein